MVIIFDELWWILSSRTLYTTYLHHSEIPFLFEIVKRNKLRGGEPNAYQKLIGYCVFVHGTHPYTQLAFGGSKRKTQLISVARDIEKREQTKWYFRQLRENILFCAQQEKKVKKIWTYNIVQLINLHFAENANQEKYHFCSSFLSVRVEIG